MFDVFYYGNNDRIAQAIPTARQHSVGSKLKSFTRMYWTVAADFELYDLDVFEFVPDQYETQYTHVWQNGAVTLTPSTASQGTKYHAAHVGEYTFRVLHTKDPGDFFDKHPEHQFVWCIDKDYLLPVKLTWDIPVGDEVFVNNFHFEDQLQDRYPDQQGGVTLYPRHWQTADVKYHGPLLSPRKWPVLYTSDIDDYSQREQFNDEFVWLVDQDHSLDESYFSWTPSLHDRAYIHVFKHPRHLLHRYPQAFGGVRLVPKDYTSAGTKTHSRFPFADKQYPIVKIPHQQFTAEHIELLMSKCNSDYLWVIDNEFDFVENLCYTPEIYDKDCIHVFKHPMQLIDRYSPSITEPWDRRCGGIWLVPRQFNINKIKYIAHHPLHLDVFWTKNTENVSYYAKLTKTDVFWLIDEEYSLTHAPVCTVPKYDQKYVNIFKVPGQLEHKYPASIVNVSDNRCGGVKLCCRQPEGKKFQGNLKSVTQTYEQFSSYDEGRAKSQHDWFWVIDPEVDVLDSFKFDYVPEVWDHGKTHVWQKVNPVTGLAYDYAGISLCHKQATGSRPKYVKHAACKQKPYTVHTVDFYYDIIEQLEAIDAGCKESMYWVIYPPFKLATEEIDFYPSQWDQKYVHISGQVPAAVLYPKGTFAAGHSITVKDIKEQSYQNQKELRQTLVTKDAYPVIYLSDRSAKTVDQALRVHCDKHDFVFTVDPDTQVIGALDLEVPELDAFSKVHVWAKASIKDPTAIHSYGGVRLWPTSMVGMISEELANHTAGKSVHYVKRILSQCKPYPVVLIGYQDKEFDKKIAYLKRKVPDLKWVQNVTGIFNAHQAAALIADAEMFWVVDSDAEVVDEFDFSYVPSTYDRNTVHVWYSLNPVTGDKYGYGGVKLFNRQQVLSADTWGLDFTTGLSPSFKVIPELSCITKFNTDPYSSWRSAFREAAKLVAQGDLVSLERLQKWLNPDLAADWAYQVMRGAQAGAEYARANRNDPVLLANINNFEWLLNEYNKI